MSCLPPLCDVQVTWMSSRHEAPSRLTVHRRRRFCLAQECPAALPYSMASSRDSSWRLPTAADVDAAAERLAGVALRTPLISSPALDTQTGGRVFLKAETLQRTGSFKFRGAYNKLRSLAPDSRR